MDNNFSKIKNMVVEADAEMQESIVDEDDVEMANEVAYVTVSILLKALCIAKASPEYRMLEEMEKEAIDVLIGTYRDLLDDMEENA